MEWPHHDAVRRHLIGRRLTDFIGSRHHPRQNADPVREHHQTLGAAFPQQTGKARRIEIHHVAQRHKVGCVTVHNHAIRAAGDRFAHAVRLEVRRQLGGRQSAVAQPPVNFIGEPLLVDLQQRQAVGGIELYVAEKLARAGNEEPAVGQFRRRFRQLNAARLGVKVAGERLNFLFQQAQRHVAAVTFVPALEPHIAGGFNHSLYKPG